MKIRNKKCCGMIYRDLIPSLPPSSDVFVPIMGWSCGVGSVCARVSFAVVWVFLSGNVCWSSIISASSLICVKSWKLLQRLEMKKRHYGQINIFTWKNYIIKCCIKDVAVTITSWSALSDPLEGTPLINWTVIAHYISHNTLMDWLWRTSSSVTYLVTSVYISLVCSSINAKSCFCVTLHFWAYSSIGLLVFDLGLYISCESLLPAPTIGCDLVFAFLLPALNIVLF